MLLATYLPTQDSARSKLHKHPADDCWYNFPASGGNRRSGTRRSQYNSVFSRRQQFLHHVFWPALQDALITASAIFAMTAAAITLAEGLPQSATAV